MLFGVSDVVNKVIELLRELLFQLVGLLVAHAVWLHTYYFMNGKEKGVIGIRIDFQRIGSTASWYPQELLKVKDTTYLDSDHPQL